ncbi:MAG: lysophospholipid acyltransferase family protein [Acidimicrobiales bacterium]
MSVVRRPSWLAHRGFPWSTPTWPDAVERAAPQRRLGADYTTGWTRRYPARLARAMVLDNVTRPLAHLLASPQVRGAEMLTLVESPAIFVANHASHIDTPLLLSVLPVHWRHKTVVAAAADHFFDRRWKAHLWALVLNAVPIERHRVNRRSADVAAALLDDGWNLVIFPEGGRSPDGWFQPFRGGAAYLAVRSGRPVVPVHLHGTRRILAKGGRGPRPSRTRVTFGAPLVPDAGEDARRFGARIEATLATMADESASDWWSARRRAAAGTTPSPGGPTRAPWRRAWSLPLATPPSTTRADGPWTAADSQPAPSLIPSA